MAPLRGYALILGQRQWVPHVYPSAFQAVKSKFIQNFSSRTLYVGIRSSAAEGYAAHRSPNSHRALRPAGGRAEMVRALGAESRTVSRRAFHHHAPEVLRPGDA